MSWLVPNKNEKPNILIVEDNQRQSELLEAIINETGLYNVLTASNDQQALEQLEKYERGFDFLTNGVACILLDWQMPNMHAEVILKLLRQKELKSPFKRRIPVVIITAFGDNDQRMVSQESTYGLASAFLLKPFEEVELLHTIKCIVLNKETEEIRGLLAGQARSGFNFMKGHNNPNR